MRKIFLISICATACLTVLRSNFVAITLATACLAGYELYLRSKFFSHRIATTVSKLKSRLSSLPYSEMEFNQDFKSIMPSQHLRRTPFARKANLSSPSINYKDGLRSTSFVLHSQISGNKVYLFGGSTIECQEVPDAFTIASQLQLQLNLAPPPLNNYEVINCGVGGATLKANFNHKKGIYPSKNDICIFYFGVNETEFPNEIYKNRETFSSIPNLVRTKDLFLRLEFITLYRILNKFLTFDESHAIFDKSVTNVEDTLKSIDSECQNSGTHFAAILQPFLHTRVPLTQFDRQNSKYYVNKSRFDASLFLYEKFKTRLNRQKFFFDATSVFNRTNLDVYTDWAHTNYQGNKIIADYFYSIIQQQLLKGQFLID